MTLNAFIRRGLFAWLALFAFTMKAAMPVGYMLAEDGLGVVACGGALFASPAQKQNPDPATADKAPCAFAGLAALALDGPGKAVAIHASRGVLQFADARLPREERPQLAPAAPPPGRGPPKFS